MKKLIGFGVAAIGLICVVGCDVGVVGPVPYCDPGYYWCGDNVGDGECIANEDDCCDGIGDWCQCLA